VIQVTKPWCIALLVLLAISIGLFAHKSDGRYFFEDGDTGLLLSGIHSEHHPWIHSWIHDWPIGNHFYRPLSTLSIQIDDALYHRNGDGWGLTNILIVIGCTVGLFWLAREVTDDPIYTTITTAIFYLWELDSGGFFTNIVGGVALAICITGIYRHRTRCKLYLPAAFVWIWFSIEMQGVSFLQSREINWVPGRTASTMLLFALPALACFARFCRLNPQRKAQETYSSTDVPATKSTSMASQRSPSKAWAYLSAFLTLLSLACYEQAVAVPLLIALVAYSWHLRNRKINWSFSFLFGLALMVYIAAHLSFVSIHPSHYYTMQRRNFGTGLLMLQRYLFFPVITVMGLYFSKFIWSFLYICGEFVAAIKIISSFYAVWEARRRWILIGFGWLGSSLAYLPMAWFKEFGHYHYFPMAIRSIAVAGLGLVAYELIIIAVSPPAIQAPARPSPAPGSLVHL